MKDIVGNNSDMAKGIRVLSLFAGAGGLDLGFHLSGYGIVYATDIDEKCCQTLKANFGSAVAAIEQADIRDLDLSSLPKDIDLIIGGPPCQSFSASSRRAGGAAGRLDERGTLFEAYCRILEHVQPSAFLFENVRGILSTNKGADWETIVESFSRVGYELSYRVLDALDYGVPQQRERLFMVGHKLEKKEFLFPRPLFGPDSMEQTPYITAGEAISNIADDHENKEELELRTGKHAHLLPKVPPGENYLFFTAKRGYPNPIFAYRSRFSDFLYKANPEAPIKTLIARPGKYTGPFHWENRRFTVRECMCLQGFPDDFKFIGDRNDQIRQIGNSVSPKISYYLAIAIAHQIFGRQVDVELLPSDYVLSFDSRKGKKAAHTRALHKKVAARSKNDQTPLFELKEYKSFVSPACEVDEGPNAFVTLEGRTSKIVVHADASDKICADMKMDIFRSTELAQLGSRPPEASLEVKVYGRVEHAVQTMWNAVDEWVRKSSNFHSLFELYGHFTEPHPVFNIVHFNQYWENPIVSFAKHISDFDNCSRYFPRQHLVELFKDQYGEKDFLEIVEMLRQYRFDIRCHETNITISKDVYMVSYPFTLPLTKQMNFSVQSSGNETRGVS